MLSGLSTRWAYAKISRWQLQWTPGTMRRAMGRIGDLTARVRMALFTLWCNGWITRWRIRHFDRSGPQLPLTCRFCGAGVDRVEHYFGLHEAPCPSVAAATASRLRAQVPPTAAEWFGLPPVDLPGENSEVRRKEVARVRYSLRRALTLTGAQMQPWGRVVDSLAQELPPSCALVEATTQHGTPSCKHHRTSSTPAGTTSTAASCTAAGTTTYNSLLLASSANATT